MIDRNLKAQYLLDRIVGGMEYLLHLLKSSGGAGWPHQFFVPKMNLGIIQDNTITYRQKSTLFKFTKLLLWDCYMSSKNWARCHKMILCARIGQFASSHLVYALSVSITFGANKRPSLQATAVKESLYALPRYCSSHVTPSSTFSSPPEFNRSNWLSHFVLWTFLLMLI